MQVKVVVICCRCTATARVFASVLATA